MSWDKGALGDLFSIGSSKRVLKSQWQTSGVPFYRGREVTKLATNGAVDNELFISEQLYAEFERQYGVPKAGDIVITAIGTIGNAYVVRAHDRFYFKDASVLWLSKKRGIESRFVNYWLQSPLFKQQLDKANGATVDTLTIQKLKSVQIDIPSLSEQKRIVATIDEAFAGIATAVANTEKNLVNAGELFETYLRVLFDRICSERSVVKLGDVCRTGSGGTPRKSERRFYEDGKIPWLLSGEVSRKEITENVKFITEYGLKNSSAKVFPKNTVLVAMYGATAGQAGILRFASATNQAVCGVYPTGKFMPEFLYYNFLYRNRELVATASGNAQPNISQIKIKNVLVPNISAEDQVVVIESLDGLSEEVELLAENYSRKLHSLAELKQSLLQKAFSGELTAVPQDEIETALA